MSCINKRRAAFPPSAVRPDAGVGKSRNDGWYYLDRAHRELNGVPAFRRRTDGAAGNIYIGEALQRSKRICKTELPNGTRWLVALGTGE